MQRSFGRLEGDPFESDMAKWAKLSGTFWGMLANSSLSYCSLFQFFFRGIGVFILSSLKLAKKMMYKKTSRCICIDVDVHEDKFNKSG